MRETFKIKLNTDKLLANQEIGYNYINGFSHKERSTKIHYASVKDVNGKTIKVPVIKYKIFDGYEDIIHGFSTRKGGVSPAHLSSLNLSFSRGDREEFVMENHRRFAEACGYDYRKLVFSDQVHTTEIYQVTAEDAGKGITKVSDIKGIDGLVTNVPGIPLITFYADCVPLYFYDPVKKVVALAHSGWKGTVEKIGTKMIKKMTEIYGSNPEDIICAIGPSICQDCYEISKDVADKFKDEFKPENNKEMMIDKGNDKYQLDLHKACKYNFLEAGVLEKNIAMPDLCTCCNADLLFSHRKSRGMRGNLAAVIMLKDNV